MRQNYSIRSFIYIVVESEKGGFLMISPVSMASVSNVRFGNQGLLEREGAYANKTPQPAAPEVSEEKKSGSGKKLAIGAVVVAAALATIAILSRNNKVLTQLSEEALKDAKWYQPKVWGHHLNKFGNKIAEWTWDPAVKLWNKVFKKAATEVPTT
jgi:hypothetical protein